MKTRFKIAWLQSDWLRWSKTCWLHILSILSTDYFFNWWLSVTFCSVLYKLTMLCISLFVRHWSGFSSDINSLHTSTYSMYNNRVRLYMFIDCVCPWVTCYFCCVLSPTHGSMCLADSATMQWSHAIGGFPWRVSAPFFCPTNCKPKKSNKFQKQGQEFTAPVATAVLS